MFANKLAIKSIFMKSLSLLFLHLQLVKMHKHTPGLEVLKMFANSGPVIDFSISNKPVGFRKLVMCSGTHEDSSVEVVSTGVGINLKVLHQSRSFLPSVFKIM